MSKRARCDDEAATVDEDDERTPFEREPSRYVDGTQCLRLRFVPPMKGGLASATSFGAEYVHQVFEMLFRLFEPFVRP